MPKCFVLWAEGDNLNKGRDREDNRGEEQGGEEYWGTCPGGSSASASFSVGPAVDWSVLGLESAWYLMSPSRNTNICCHRPGWCLLSLLASLLSKSELIKMSTRNKSKLKDETEKDEFVLNLDNVRWSWPSLPATEPVPRSSASLSLYIRTTEIMLVVGQILTWEPASSSI